VTPALIIGGSLLALVVNARFRHLRPRAAGSNGTLLGDLVAAVRACRKGGEPA
jgi:hypothetical protein